MDALKDSSDDLPQGKSDTTVSGDVKLIVDKQISANDIRARILRLPKAITNMLSEDTQKVRVVFNGLSEKELTIAKNRHILAGVTDLYKEIRIYLQMMVRIIHAKQYGSILRIGLRL